MTEELLFLEHSDEPFACLGVPRCTFNELLEAAKEADIIDKSRPVFDSLPRPGVLPGKCQITAKRKSTQELLDRFWNGEGCHFSWCYEEDTFHFVATIDEKDDRNGEGAYVHVEHSVPSGSEEGSIEYSVSTSDSLARNLLSGCSHQDILATRLLHQFFRQYGHRIQWHHLFPLLDFVREMWLSSRACLEELLDCSILIADLAMLVSHNPEFENLQRKPLKTYTFVYVLWGRIGEALHSLDRTEEWTMLCVEILQNFQADREYELMLLVRAGLGYTTLKRKDEGLMYFMKAMSVLRKTKGNSWNFNDAETRFVIANLVSQHVIVSMNSSLQVNGWEQSDAFVDHALPRVLSSLLGAVGFKLPPSGQENAVLQYAPHIQMRMRTAQLHSDAVMKPTYMRPKIARHTLLKAFHAPTVEGYKQVLLGAVRENCVCMPPNLSAEEISTTLQDIQQGVQTADLVNRRAGVTVRQTCCHCGVSESHFKAFQMCSCKDAIYCSVACQNDDWKEHKEWCTFGKKIKQCSFCDAHELSGEKLWKCECGDVYYCSVECRMDHWKEHKQTCHIHLARKASSSSKKQSKKRGKKRGKKT